MNPMDRQLFFKGFYRMLCTELSPARASVIWHEAGQEYTRILTADPKIKKHKGAMAIPVVALYKALSEQGEDAERLLNAYGDRLGRKFARAAQGITCIPGVSRILWRHVDSIMDKMSSEKHGYKRRIVSEPPEMYGVDILSCPYHELARELGAEKAVLCICHLDKAYMKGFQHIRYERTTAVSEGAECCDYRLHYTQ